MTTCLRCTDYALTRSRGYKTLMGSNSDLVEDQARIGVKVAIYRSTIHHPSHYIPRTLHSTSHTYTEHPSSRSSEVKIKKHRAKMPKAVSSTFRPATIANPKKKGSEASGSGTGSGSGGNAATGSAGSGGRNHLFNTERFGQHILTNPAVAQG